MYDFAGHASMFSEDSVTYLDDHIRDNAWLSYFEKISFSGRNWIDFEAEIGHVLRIGIADDSFQDTLDYIYFQKYFQRIQKRTGSFYKEWLVKPKHPTSDDATAKVFIMGHSLNKVDKGVLQDFFYETNVDMIKIFYYSQSGYESQVINLIDMFGKDFAIDQTGRGRIVFEKLEPATVGRIRSANL